MELEPMSSFHFESFLPSSQTDPVGDVDEIFEFENNFVSKNITNSEEISVKKCVICQETIDFGFKKHVKYCKLYFQFWTRTPTGFKCRLCLQKLKKNVHKHFEAKHCKCGELQCQFCKAKYGDKQALCSHMKRWEKKMKSIISKKLTNLQNPDRNTKETRKEKNNAWQEMISGEKKVLTSKTKESLQGEKAKKKCEICQEMVGLGFSIHVKHCRLYFKYTKKHRNGYKCKLCPFENYTSRAQKIVHRHIKENHSNVNEAVQNSRVFESHQKDHNFTLCVDKEEKINRLEKRDALEKEGKHETMKKCVVILKQLNLDHKKLGIKERETSVGPQLVQDTSTTDKQQLPIKKLYTGVHENNKLYQCRACDKEFSTSSGLKDHIVKIHKGRKIFQCPICSDKFIDEEKMNEHIVNIHNGRKIFQCPICSDKFIDEEKMNDHVVKIHKGRKIFQCPICPDKFIDEEKMNEHISTVHEGKKKLNVANECYELEKEENSGKYVNNFQTCQFCLEKVSNLNEHIKNCSKYQKSINYTDNIKKETVGDQNIEVSNEIIHKEERNENGRCESCQEIISNTSTMQGLLYRWTAAEI